MSQQNFNIDDLFPKFENIPVQQTPAEEPGFWEKAWNTGGAIIEGIGMIPGGLVDTVRDAWSGGDIDVTDTEALKARQEREQEIAAYRQKYQGKTFEGATDAMLSLPYSLGTMGASLGAGAAGTLVGGPVAGAAAGMAASGTMAYRASKQDFMEQVLDQTAQVLGRMPTQEEWNRVAAEFDSEATQYGLWEAGPEALSNLFMAKLLGPLGKSIFKGGVGNAVKRVGGLYGEELATETVTQMGQGHAAASAGLREEAPGLVESFKEIAPATLWQTTLMAGGKKVGDLAYNRWKNRGQNQEQVPVEGEGAPVQEAVQATTPENAAPFDNLSMPEWNAPDMATEAWNNEAERRGWDHMRTEGGISATPPTARPSEAAPVGGIGMEASAGAPAVGTKHTYREGNYNVEIEQTPQGTAINATIAEGEGAGTLVFSNTSSVPIADDDLLQGFRALYAPSPVRDALERGESVDMLQGLSGAGPVNQAPAIKPEVQQMLTPFSGAETFTPQEMVRPQVTPQLSSNNAPFMDTGSFTPQAMVNPQVTPALPGMIQGIGMQPAPAPVQQAPTQPAQPAAPFMDTSGFTPQGMTRPEMTGQLESNNAPFMETGGFTPQGMVQPEVTPALPGMIQGIGMQPAPAPAVAPVQQEQAAPAPVAPQMQPAPQARPTQQTRQAPSQPAPQAPVQTQEEKPAPKTFAERKKELLAQLPEDLRKKAKGYEMPRLKKLVADYQVAEESQKGNGDNRLTIVGGHSIVRGNRVGYANDTLASKYSKNLSNADAAKGYALRYAKRLNKPMLVHAGNSYGNFIWRVAEPEKTSTVEMNDINSFDGWIVHPDGQVFEGRLERKKVEPQTSASVPTADMVESPAEQPRNMEVRNGQQTAGTEGRADTRRSQGNAGTAPERTAGDETRTARGSAGRSSGSNAGVEGRRRSKVKIPNHADEAVSYELLEAGDVQSSHLPEAGFQKNPGYQLENERRYHDEPASQAKVLDNAQKLDPAFLIDSVDANHGAPVIDRQGNVLGGNGRAMSVRMAYDRFPERADAYRQALRERAESLGLDPAQVDAMQQPVLVRRLDRDMSADERQSLVAALNDTFTDSKNARASGKSRGDRLSRRTLEALASGLAEADTLRAYFDEDGSEKVVEMLIRDGVIQKTERNAYIGADGLLNPDGKRIVEEALRGRVARSYEALASLPGPILAKIDAAIPHLLVAESIGGAWNITDHMRDAIDLMAEFQSSGEKLPETFLKRMDMLKGKAPVDRYSQAAQALFLGMNKLKKAEYVKDFAAYAGQAKISPEAGGMGIGEKQEVAAEKSLGIKPERKAEPKTEAKKEEFRAKKDEALGSSQKHKSGGQELLQDADASDGVNIRISEPEGNPAQAATGDPIEEHRAFFERVQDGKVSLDDFKGKFQEVRDREQAYKDALNKLTRDQLLKMGGPLFAEWHKQKKKADLVDLMYRDMLNSFALGRSVSVTVGFNDDYQAKHKAAIEKIVNEQTDESLAEYAKKRAKQRAEAEERNKEVAEALKNPKTLQDFMTFVDAQVRQGKAKSPKAARDMLTSEQKATFDRLLAENSRSRRKDKAEPVAQTASQQTNGKIIETKHTKKGHDLFVVQLDERLDREDYNTLLSNAKKMDGYYSSYRGGGAVPGFQFKTRENAEAFLKLVQGDSSQAQEAMQARRDAFADDRSQTAVQRLNEMADRLEGNADAKLNADRKVNTDRRMRQAAAADEAAQADKALAKTMRSIARSIENGKAVFLDRVREKKQVELLLKALRVAKWNEDRTKYDDWQQREEHRYDPPTSETVENAEFPSYSLFPSTWQELARKLAGIKGLKRSAEALQKMAGNRNENEKITIKPETADLIFSKLGADSDLIPWQLKDARQERRTLERMGIETAPEFRTALRELIGHLETPKRDELREMEREVIRDAIKNRGFLDFFPTPEPVVQEMLTAADIQPGMDVLEPSAGMGHIADRIRETGVEPKVVELDLQKRKLLEAKGYDVVGNNFMEDVADDTSFDRIVMNPPFSKRQDVDHVRHAYDLLKPGGRLVAIMSEGPFNGQDKKAEAFREWLDEVGGTSEKLPEGSFNDPSLPTTTGVNTRMVVVEKPNAPLASLAGENLPPHSGGGRTPRINAVRRMVSKINARAQNKASVEVVEKSSDLPEHLRNAFDGKRLEGLYDPTTDTVWIVSENLGSVERAAEVWAHETLVHHGLRTLFQPQERRIMLNNLFMKLGGMSNPRIREVSRLYGVDPRSNAENRILVMEELLAQTAEQRAQNLLDTQGNSIWRNIVNAVTRWWNTVIERVTGRPGRMDMSHMERLLDALQGHVLDGKPVDTAEFLTDESPLASLDDSSREEAERAWYQLQEDMENWGRQVDEFDPAAFGTSGQRKLLTVCHTPDVLRKLGAPDLPMTMMANNLGKVLSSKRDHNLPKNVVKQLPAALAEPIMVFESATQPDAFVVMTELKHEGRSVMVAVHLDTQRQNIQVNDIASAYRRGSEGWYIRQIEDGRLLYQDKKKSLAWARTNRLQLPKVRKLPARLSERSERARNARLQLPLVRRLPSGLSEGRILTEADIVKPIAPLDAPLASLADTVSAAARGLRGIMGRGPDKDVQEIMDDPEMGRLVSKKDMSFLERVFTLPHYMAKKFKEFAPIYRRQQDRAHERSSAIKKATETVSLLFDPNSKNRLKAKEVDQLAEMIWEWDGKEIGPLHGINKFRVKETLDNGREILEMNPRYVEKQKAWLDTQPQAARVKEAFAQVRQVLDDSFLTTHNRMAHMSDIDDGIIQQYRTEIGNVQNYFPHKREGKYAAIAKVGKTETVYRQHFDVPLGSSIKEEWAKIVAANRKDFPGAEWTLVENQKLPEDVLGAPIDVEAMEQIIMAGTKKLGDSEHAEQVRQIMLGSVSDILKSRGFGAHAIHRTGIPGFKKDDIATTLYDYISGLHGWMTKMDAARDFTESLGKIDAISKPELWSYAQQYVKDMLRNSDKIDRWAGNIKSIAFAWYLGGNIKTAVVNLTQNLTVGVPLLQSYVTGGAQAWLRAAYNSIGLSYTGKGLSAARNLTDDEKAMLDKLYGEGVITDAYMEELRGQVSRSPVLKTWSKFTALLGKPMSVIEHFNRGSLALAAYRAARAGQWSERATREFGYKPGQKATHEQAMAFASHLVSDAHYEYGRGNMPEMFRSGTVGRVISPAYTFRSFSANTLNLWWHSLRHGGKEGRWFVAKNLGANLALGGLTAFPFYATFTALLAGATGDDEDLTAHVRKILPESNLVRDLACYGVPSLFGVNLGGSMRMETPFTDGLQRGTTFKEAIDESILGLMGIPYDLFVEKPSKVAENLKYGQEWKAVETLVPTFISNAMQAYRLATEGQTGKKGAPINSPGQDGARKLSLPEALGKVAGFQPLSSSKSYDAYLARKRMDDARSAKLNELVLMELKARDTGDRTHRIQMMKELRAWNKRMEEEGKESMKIPTKSINRSAAQRRRQGSKSPTQLQKGAEQQAVWGI